MADYQHLSPTDIKARLDGGERIRILDVREQEEWDICHIEGAELKPLSQIQTWAAELQGSDAPIVLHCHHGMRSQQACDLLAASGVEGLINMLGGIAQWAQSVDLGMAQY